MNLIIKKYNQIRILTTIFLFLFVVVACSKKESHEVNNAPIPRIIELIPANASPGDELTIRGVNFSSEMTGNEIKFNQMVVDPIAVSDTIIKIKIPEISGNVAGVSVRSNGKISNKRNLIMVRIKTFEDDFNRANQDYVNATAVPNPLGSNWQIVNGRFSLKDQKIYSNEPSVESYMLYRDQELSMNAGGGSYYKFRTDVNVTAGSFAGIMFNVQNDNKRLYLIRINADLVQLLKTGDNGLGDWANVMMSQNFPGMVAGVTYRIEVTSSTPGKLLIKITNPQSNEIFVDRSFEDPTPYEGGAAGIYFFGLANPLNITYDNFYIETM